MKFKRTIAVFMSCAMLISLAGCKTTGGKGQDEAKIKNQGKGRYVEREYKIPENIQIKNMKVLESGDISMVAKNPDGSIRNYTSKNKGETWDDKKIEIPHGGSEKITLTEVSILADGEIILSYYSKNNESSENKLGLEYLIVDKDGNKKDVDLDKVKETTIKNDKGNSGGSGFTIANGDIFFKIAKEVVQVDKETWKEKNRYVCDEIVESFQVLEDRLIIGGYGVTNEYEIGEKNKTGDLENIKDKRLVGNDGKDTIYCYDELGLYSYNVKTKEIEKIIEGSLSKFGNTNFNLVGFQKCENSDFLVAFGGEKNALVNYYYSEDEPVTLTKELKIYSLLGSKEEQQVVNEFKEAHPDIQVKYEYGMDGSGRVTEMDAIKKLNTEIMAGDGPDVILLDNLPVESYIKEGLLEDLSDIISEYTANDLIFKSIEKANTSDGKIYKFPTTITLPMLIGNKNTMDNIKDLDSLTKTVKDLASNSNKRIFDFQFTEKELVYALYYIYGQNWLNKDNTINEENLKNFFESAKDIHKINYEKYEKYRVAKGYPKPKESNDDINIFDIENNLSPRAYPETLGNDSAPNLVYGGIISPDLYSNLISVMNADKNLGYKILSRENENIYIPTDVVGISSKGKNKENAKTFVKEMLSEKSQNQYRLGFPVNKQAFKDQFDLEKRGIKGTQFDETLKHHVFGSADGAVQINFKKLWPNEEDVNKLMEQIEEVDTTPTANIMILMEVAKQFKAYAKGEEDIDKAIDNVKANLELYLAE